jgi:hypothetical protein
LIIDSATVIMDGNMSGLLQELLQIIYIARSLALYGIVGSQGFGLGILVLNGGKQPLVENK